MIEALDEIFVFEYREDESGDPSRSEEKQSPSYEFRRLNSSHFNVTPSRGSDFDIGNSSLWFYDPDFENDRLMQRVKQTLNVYVAPLIWFAGGAGNLLAFLVFATTHLKHQSSSVYLASLAVVDNLFLANLSVFWFSSIGFAVFRLNGLCQLAVFLAYVSNFLSVWYIVAFTLDRYVIVEFPLRKDWFCSSRRAKLFVGLIAFSGICLYCFSTLTYGVIVINSISFCMPLPQYFKLMTVITTIDSFIAFVIPSLAILILNARILFKIYRINSTPPLTSSSMERNTELHGITRDLSHRKSIDVYHSGMERSLQHHPTTRRNDQPMKTASRSEDWPSGEHIASQ